MFRPNSIALAQAFKPIVLCNAVGGVRVVSKPVLPCKRCDGTEYHNGGSCEACDGSGHQLCEYCDKRPARHEFTHTFWDGRRTTDLICDGCWAEVEEGLEP